MTDRPWEGNACSLFTIFQDGGRYRMYYRGWHFVTGTTLEFPRRQVICYAESLDGIRWNRPNLGMVEFEGSKENNIILDRLPVGGEVHTFVPFQGHEPCGRRRCPLQGILSGKGQGALRLEVSPTASTGIS